MNKGLKITLNILVFTLIIGFGYYMIHSMMSDDKTTRQVDGDAEHGFVSPYKKINSFNTASQILCFDVFENAAYIVLSDKISVYGEAGTPPFDFAIETGARDIVVEKEAIYLLYPTRIEVYAFDGQKQEGWEACSPQSDYCAFSLSKDYVFVTDAANKEMVQYYKQGGLVRFIQSHQGFVIPSYSFDIININDTIYCSNSGRHQIESYTVDGVFIASFGASGAGAGAFAGCCNPVYLAKSANGNILTSEKGNPRISCYGKDGKFRSILFDSFSLGGGTDAYKMRVSSENIYIAHKKTISVYAFDANQKDKSCAGCPEECML